MENPNLEFIIDKERDSDSLDDIRIQVFNCLLNIKNIALQKNFNFFNNTILLSFLNDNNNIKLEKTEKEVFLKFLDMFQQDDIFITCEKSYMEYMKMLFDPKLFTVLRNKFMYCKGSNIDKSQRELINRANFLLKSGVGFYSDYKEISNVLSLKNLRKVKINSNEDINKIFSGLEHSNYYLIQNELDSKNIERLKQSKLLCFEYYNQSVSSKYYLLRSLMKVGIEENLPTFSLRKMLENLNHYNYFETVSYKMYLKISSSCKLNNLQIESFTKLEEAIAYNILLDKKGIHGVMIKYQHKFNICYRNLEKVKFELPDNIKEAKKILLDNFSQSEISNFDLNTKDLYYLTNIVMIEFNKRKEKEDERNGEIILPDNKQLFTSNGYPIPIEIMENRNMYCYNVFNDITKLQKNYYSFDRSKINIDVDIEIEFMEKIDFIYALTIKNSQVDVTLKKDIFIDGDIDKMEKMIRNLWKQGFFLTDYGIYRYGIMGILRDPDIQFPKWFHSDDVDSYKWLTMTLNSLSI